MANLYENDNKSKDAIRVLSDLLYDKPDCYKASIMLGDIYYKTEDFKKAIDVYTEALKYKVNDYDLYYNLGMAYISFAKEEKQLRYEYLKEKLKKSICGR